ncbi:MAG: WecB/TagA/CpsF family glycosyltransferase [Bryobacteraceae bacterium]
MVAGVRISATSYDDVVRQCGEWISEKREIGAAATARYICVTSVHGIVTARSDRRFRDILNRADMATPDGMPVVWAMRSLGRKQQKRVYGPDLMLRLCECAASRGHRVFLYGGRPEVLPQLAERLQAKMPQLEIAGMYSPPFRPLTAEEDAAVVHQIRQSGADIVFVGISTPKQEHWMSQHVDSLPGTIMLGVGAAFDFHAGRVKQAPAWMQRAGLEWFFRLLMEPMRLWRRYLLETPRFLPLWAMQKAGWMRFSDADEI